MKAQFIIWIIGFAVIHSIGYAGPPAGDAVAPISKPASTLAQFAKPATPQTQKAPPRSSRNATRLAGNAFVGGPTKPAPSITGAVNPGKNTAAVSGTGMKRKP
jgi:hypothetical protein